MKHIDAIGHEVVEHPDDIAINRFAVAMKAKMAKQRAKGYGGWNDPASCPTERLQQMLADHIPKGDPVDVGNFAMMLWNRGGRTGRPTQQQRPVGVVAPDPGRVDWLRNEPEVGVLLYTSPPAGRPLTDAEIKKLWIQFAPHIGAPYEFARAIEAFHGIKGNA